MRFDILTIFPKIIEQYSGKSILKRGQASGAIKITAHNFRDFALDKHHIVDDSPYGGGPGMVLKAEPIYSCLQAIGALRRVIPAKAEIQKKNVILRAKPEGSKILPLHFVQGFGSLAQNDNKKTKIIILDPAGKKFDQKMARRFSKLERLVLICGRYEGFDERVYKFVDEKISIGDYVLSGGELPALVVAEAVARLVPGVVGNAESLKEETHNVIPAPDRGRGQAPAGIQGKKKRLDSRSPMPLGDKFHGNDIVIEYPQYTRPENFMDMKVPKVLLSGNHKKIEEWRKKKSQKVSSRGDG